MHIAVNRTISSLRFLSQGKAEFIGRTMARPHLKLLDEPYERPRFPPPLEWHQLIRGTEAAGDLLAVFELLQVRTGGRMRARVTINAFPEASLRLEIFTISFPNQHRSSLLVQV